MAHFFLKKIKPLADRCKKVYIYRSTVVNFAATFEPKIEANNFQFMDTRRRGRSVSFEPEIGVITFTASLISFFDLSSEFITSTLARALRLTSIHFQARNLTKKTPLQVPIPQTSKRNRLLLGRPATVYSHGADSRGKSIHWPRIQRHSVFYVG